MWAHHRTCWLNNVAPRYRPLQYKIGPSYYPVNATPTRLRAWSHFCWLSPLSSPGQCLRSALDPSPGPCTCCWPWGRPYSYAGGPSGSRLKHPVAGCSTTGNPVDEAPHGPSAGLPSSPAPRQGISLRAKLLRESVPPHYLGRVVGTNRASHRRPRRYTDKSSRDGGAWNSAVCEGTTRDALDGIPGRADRRREWPPDNPAALDAR